MDREISNIAELEAEERLPSPKGLALAIVDACRRDDSSIRDVQDLVRTDPALCSRLIRLANSAHYGMRAIAGANDAVARLGMKSVRQLALSFSLVDQYQQGECQGFDYRHF